MIFTLWKTGYKNVGWVNDINSSCSFKAFRQILPSQRTKDTAAKNEIMQTLKSTAPTN